MKSRRGKKIKKNQEKEVFSGLFWVGNKALDFGLVDGIGSMNTILKDRFGKNYKIKYIDQKKSFIQRKLSSSLSGSILNAEELIDKIEEKSLLSRYGL